MRVLHIINNLERGGAERLLVDMLPRMQGTGNEVSVYLLELKDRALYDELTARGIPVVCASAGSLYSPAHIFAIRKLINCKKIQVVHAHLFPSMFWAACALLSHRKVVLIATEHNTWNRRRKAWFRLADRFMYSRYDRICCISAQTAEALIQWLPTTAPQISVVENGIDLERFTGHATPSFPRKDSLIVSVGRLTRQKAFGVLIKAAAAVPSATFWIVGNGPLRDELESLATTLGVHGRVQFLGMRDDIPAIFRQATIYVQCSDWEGFGIAAVEAMCAGLPVVASDVPGLREVVGDAGILFAAGSAEQLANHLNRLLQDRIQREVLGRCGKIRASRFAIARTVQAYISLYEHEVCLKSARREGRGYRPSQN